MGSNFSYLGSGFKEAMGIFRKESIGMAIPITNNYGRELEKQKERNNCQCYNQEDGGQGVKLAGKKPEDKWAEN